MCVQGLLPAGLWPAGCCWLGCRALQLCGGSVGLSLQLVPRLPGSSGALCSITWELVGSSNTWPLFATNKAVVSCSPDTAGSSCSWDLPLLGTIPLVGDELTGWKSILILAGEVHCKEYGTSLQTTCSCPWVFLVLYKGVQGKRMVDMAAAERFPQCKELDKNALSPCSGWWHQACWARLCVLLASST